MAFWSSMGVAFRDILTAPWDPGLWWQLLPVLFLWFLLEIYLNRHKEEELGWNSALGNAISLFWIVLAAMQPLFFHSQYERFMLGRFVVLGLILLYAIFAGFVAFTHSFGKRTSYVLCYPTVMYYLATFAILWGHKALALNAYVLIAFVLLWFVVVGLRFLFFWMIPQAPDESESEPPRVEQSGSPEQPMKRI